MASDGFGEAGTAVARPPQASGGATANPLASDRADDPTLHLPVLEVGPKRGRRTLTAEKVIESLVVPSYPQTSRSSTRGVLTMVPVASVEKDLNPKSFVAYKSPSGKSRKLTNQLSLTFGFCSYEWTEYPCSGIDACANVPRAVLDVPHTALEPGDTDQYAVYERLFEEASAETPSTNTELQALAREWEKYTSVVVPFILKPCPNVLCARLETPPRGKVVTIQASGRKFLGCPSYSRANRMGHKNASITSIQNLDNIEQWLSEERYVLARMGRAALTEVSRLDRRVVLGSASGGERRNGGSAAAGDNSEKRRGAGPGEQGPPSVNVRRGGPPAAHPPWPRLV